MKPIDSLPLPTLLRYGATGIIALILFVVAPWMLYNPSAVTELATPGAVAALSAYGFILGFVLDALKLYQWSPGYKASKRYYFDSIRDLVGGSDVDARSASSLAVRLEKEINGGEIFFQHSRWVMAAEFGTLFCFSGSIGVPLGVVLTKYSVIVGIRFCLVGAALVLLGIRMFKSANRIRTSVNEAYLHFCKANLPLLRKMGGVVPTSERPSE